MVVQIVRPATVCGLSPRMRLDVSVNLVKKVKKMIKYAPDWLRISNISTDNKTSFELDNGSWIKASEQIKNSKENLGNIHFLTGPNTTLDFNDRKKVISNVSKLYSNFSIPKSLTIIEYNFTDIDWAQKQYDSIRSINYDPNIAKNGCASEFGCS